MILGLNALLLFVLFLLLLLRLVNFAFILLLLRFGLPNKWATIELLPRRCLQLLDKRLD